MVPFYGYSPVPAKQGKRLTSTLQKCIKKDLISEVFIR